MTKELEITSRQRDVYRLLKNHRDTKQLCVGEWYLGALYALDNSYNPDRFSQAAHSLRELIMKLDCESNLEAYNGTLNKIAHYEPLSGKDKTFKDSMEKLEEYIIENLQDEKIENNISNQKFITKSYSADLKPTSQQQDIVDLLKEGVDTKKICFSQKYLGALYALDNPYNPDRFSQAANSLRELIEIQRSYDTHTNKKKKVRNIEFTKKSHERNDPNIRVLSPNIQDSIQEDDEGLRKKLQKITHHEFCPSQDEFEECITKLENNLRLLKPNIIRDRRELENLLNQPKTNDADREKILQLIKRGSNFIFFFEKIDDDETWLPFLNLHENVFFHKAPDDIKNWPLISYLKKVSGKRPKEVVEIILEKIKETSNPTVLEAIPQIALKTPLEESIKLKDWVFKYLRSSRIDPKIVNKLIEHWSKEDIDGMNTVMELIKEIVSFELYSTKGTEPYPKLEDQEYRELLCQDVSPISEKQAIEILRILIEATSNMPQPRPKLWNWAYCQILRQGVSFVSERQPLEVSRILIEATSNMLDMEKERDNYRDTSERWCEDLDKIEEECKTSRDHMCKLIQTLTFACKQVYDKRDFLEIEELDRLLTDQKWFVFRRIQYHLYSANLNEQTKPKIRELILSYDYDFGDEYGYEFQRMVCRACEHFGEKLLTKDERQKIFDNVMDGPSQEKRKYWQKRRFRPFKSVLFGEYNEYYGELNASETKKIFDEDYRNKAITITEDTSENPKLKKELAKLSDQKLLDRINSHLGEEFIVKRKIDAEIDDQELAEEFGNLFKESIMTDSSRINFWLENLEKVKDPTYVHSIFNKISVDVRDGKFKELNIWFEFCKKVLFTSSEELIDYCYYDVVAFINACLQGKQPPATKENYKSLLLLLSTLCTKFGWQMAWRNMHHARRQAFAALIKFGCWILKHNIAADIKVITIILEERFNDRQHPLTLPERETLAEKYISIYKLDAKWAIEHKSKFFPRDSLEIFKKTFAQFLDADEICSQTFEVAYFEIVYDELVYSIKNLTEFEFVVDFFESLTNGRGDNSFVESLDKYLTRCYIEGAYSLKGNDSLLQKYYQQIRKIPKIQGWIFHTMGNLIDDYTDQESIKKFKDYFDWRFQENTKELKRKELEQFYPWFETDYLDAEWRLDNYSKILDSNITLKENVYVQSKKLNMLLEQNPERVVRCLRKLVKVIKGNAGSDDIEKEHAKPTLMIGSDYIEKEHLKPILITGLRSKNENMRKNAKQTRNDLIEILNDSSWVKELEEKYKIS